MTTSALTLQRILNSVATEKNKNKKFIEAVVESLEIEGEDPQLDAARILRNLVVKAEKDIADLPVDDQLKAYTKKHIAPFIGLKNFSFIRYTIQQAQSNFLAQPNLEGLTGLHLSLTGHIESIELKTDSKKLIEDVRSIRDELLATDMPKQIVRILDLRLGQIETILRHFDCFGTDELLQETEALIGAIVVHAPSQNKKSWKFFVSLAAVSATVLTAINLTDDTLESIVSIPENGRILIEMVQSTTDDDNE